MEGKERGRGGGGGGLGWGHGRARAEEEEGVEAGWEANRAVGTGTGAVPRWQVGGDATMATEDVHEETHDMSKRTKKKKKRPTTLGGEYPVHI